MKKGTQVIYITGNHDEFLRKYTDLSMGNLFLTDKYLLEIEGKKHWIFHGDVFDHTTSGGAKFIAKLGGLADFGKQSHQLGFRKIRERKSFAL